MPDTDSTTEPTASSPADPPTVEEPIGLRVHNALLDLAWAYERADETTPAEYSEHHVADIDDAENTLHELVVEYANSVKGTLDEVLACATNRNFTAQVARLEAERDEALRAKAYAEEWQENVNRDREDEGREIGHALDDQPELELEELQGVRAARCVLRLIRERDEARDSHERMIEDRARIIRERDEAHQELGEARAVIGGEKSPLTLAKLLRTRNTSWIQERDEWMKRARKSEADLAAIRASTRAQPAPAEPGEGGEQMTDLLGPERRLLVALQMCRDHCRTAIHDDGSYERGMVRLGLVTEAQGGYMLSGLGQTILTSLEDPQGEAESEVMLEVDLRTGGTRDVEVALGEWVIPGATQAEAVGRIVAEVERLRRIIVRNFRAQGVEPIADANYRRAKRDRKAARKERLSAWEELTDVATAPPSAAEGAGAD